MNVLETQTRVMRELAEINWRTLGSLAGATEDGIRRYWELNQRYLQRLGDGGGPQQLLALPAEYGRELVVLGREDGERRLQILSDGVAAAIESLRGAQSAAAAAAPAPVGEASTALAAATAEAAGAAAHAVERSAEAVAASNVELESDPVIPEPPADGEDKLRLIRGIGPGTAARLRDAGITTLEQIADLDLEELDDASHPLYALKGRIEADQWVDKARELLDAED